MRLGKAPLYYAPLELYNPTLAMVTTDREEVCFKQKLICESCVLTGPAYLTDTIWNNTFPKPETQQYLQVPDDLGGFEQIL